LYQGFPAKVLFLPWAQNKYRVEIASAKQSPPSRMDSQLYETGLAKDQQKDQHFSK